MTSEPAVRPFSINVPDQDLEDLRARLRNTRWAEPSPEKRLDFERGVPLDYLRELAAHWSEFDWRATESELNALPQFITEIDGQPIHFLHVRSPEADAMPLLLAHGYPGSVLEFLDLVGPLTDPRSHGGEPGDAFHLVIPSLPGFGFSIPVREQGWEMGRTTEAFAALMNLLGYDRYAVFGGDIGAGIAGRLGATRPERVIGTVVATDPGMLGLAGEQFPIPEHLTEPELARIERERAAWQAERGYLVLQSHRPETIGAALTDSPVGQLAWIAEKYATWTHPSADTPERAVGRDRLLGTVSLYWFTRTGMTAARFLREAEHADLDWIAPSGVPAGWVVFNAEPVIRRFMDPEGHFAFWSEHAQGGHFPALEEPDLLVDDLRSFLRTLR